METRQGLFSKGYVMISILALLWAGCLTSEMQDSASAIAERAFATGDSTVAWAAWDAANMDRFACQLPGTEFERIARKDSYDEDRLLP